MENLLELHNKTPVWNDGLLRTKIFRERYSAWAHYTLIHSLYESFYILFTSLLPLTILLVAFQQTLSPSLCYHYKCPLPML